MTHMAALPVSPVHLLMAVVLTEPLWPLYWRRRGAPDPSSPHNTTLFIEEPHLPLPPAVRGLISNVKLMAGWKEASESLASNMQTTDGSHRLTSTSYRAWTLMQ